MEGVAYLIRLHPLATKLSNLGRARVTLMKKRNKAIVRELWGYAKALVLALFITTFLFTTVGVAGSSMEPTLNGGVSSVSSLRDMARAFAFGDRLFVPKYETWLRRANVLGDYQRGDVIVFRENPDSPCRTTKIPALLIKRLIGLPGDSVTIENGRVYINGAALDQSFITGAGGMLGSSSLPAYRLQTDEYFVLGDNRNHSCDSRTYGPIHFGQIVGRPNSVIFPSRRENETNWRALRRPESFDIIPEP